MSWLSFLNLALLPFAFLALVPIALHLLTLHRLKTVELSTYRFLFDSYVQQRRRMQFLEALLAALRALFILLLVLAFCRPLAKNFAEYFQAGSSREVVMLVDCSASMNAATGGVTALDRAKANAVKELERMGGNNRLTIIRVGAHPEEVISRFTSDKEELRTRLEELKVGPSRANFYAALNHLFGPEAPEALKRARPITYLYTDCQASGWREAQKQGLDRLVPADAEFVVVNVGSKEPIPNLAVIGNRPGQHHAVVGLPVYLTPQVANHGKNSAEVTVNVLIDEKEVGRTKFGNLQPGESASQRLIYYPSETGSHRGRFEIATAAADGFPDDNHYDFILSVVQRPKVLIVNGNPSQNELENDGLYLRAALKYQSEDEDRVKKTPEKRGEREFARQLEVQEIPEAGLNLESLKDVSVVILANCGGLNVTHFGWLRDFVAAGGGLLLFPGDKVSPALYNDQFFPAGASGDRLTTVRLGNPEGDPEKADTFERLAAIDFTHEVMQVFTDAKRKHFKSVAFYRRFPLLMPEKAGNATALATFAGGKPAIVESHFGDGVVFLAAFPANTRWTNLPTRGSDFWPLVMRLVLSARQRPEVDGPSVVRADGSAEFVVNGSWTSAAGTVTDPSGKTIPLEFHRSGNRLAAALDRADVRGYYSVKIQGGRTDQPKLATLAFAVNLAPEESETALLGSKEFKETLPGTVHFVDATAQTQQHGVNDQKDYTSYLVYLVFLVIIVEFTLATMGGGKKENEETRSVSERIRDVGTGSWVARMTGAGKRAG